MTQPREAVPADWSAPDAVGWVSPNHPSISPERVRLQDQPIAPFSDDVWPLAALGYPPNGHPVTLHFRSRGGPLAGLSAPGFEETVKRIAYLLINERTPAAVLLRQGTNAVEWPSATTIYIALNALRNFLDWAIAQEVGVLADCHSGLLDEYQTHVLAQDVHPTLKERRLSIVWRVHLHADALPEQDRICEPPWAQDYSVRRGVVAGSATDIIDPATMDPLLTWSLSFIRDFAVDIFAARERAFQLAQAVAVADLGGRTLTGVDDSRAALSAYLDETGGRLPGRLVGGKPNASNDYMAARLGVSTQRWRNLMEESRDRWEIDPALPAYVDSPIQATVHDQPWTEGIDYRDVFGGGSDLPPLLRHLQGAAFTTLAYLSAARPEEVLSLPRDCLEPIPPHQPGATTGYLLNGVVRKRRRTDGSGEGDPAVWGVIKPGADAVGVLHALHQPGPWLFPGVGTKALTTGLMGDRVNQMIAYVNGLVDRLGLPSAFYIPEDPEGPVTPRRFRRSLAWHIESQPGGEVALAVQYQQASTSLGRDGYSSTSNIGVRKMMSEEAATAHTATLRSVGTALTQGIGVSGVAADRLVQAAKLAQPLLARIASPAEERRLLSDPDLQVHDNPNAYSLCVFNRATAMCEPDDDNPDRGACDLACVNHARTDDQIDSLRQHVAQHREEASSPLTPAPLQLALQRSIERDQRLIAEHERTRRVVMLPMPVARSAHSGEREE